MSRSGYSDDCEDQWASIRWRGAVNSAIKGARGQAFLRELLADLEAMPNKRLVSGELQAEGDYCALGVVGHGRGMDLSKIDTEDWSQLSEEFGISAALAREIMFENDDAIADERAINVQICGPMRRWESHTQLRWEPNPNAGRRRWELVHKWATNNLKDLIP